MFSRFELLQGGVSYLLLSSGAQRRVVWFRSRSLLLDLLDPIDRARARARGDRWFTELAAGDNSTMNLWRIVAWRAHCTA